MSSVDLVIRGRRVITQQGIGPASVHVSRGRIAAISSYEDLPAGGELVEADEPSVIMPGLVDTHVHVNEPGRTHWEGFATATRAAAAGGVTTIVDMPLNSIPATTTLDALNQKLAVARGQLHVDSGFWGGVVPGNTSELPRLWEAGVAGFKCFLIPSGVDEFPNVSEADLREAMPVLAQLGATLIVHAELPGPVDAACCQIAGDLSSRAYETFLRARPREAENQAVDLMIRLCRETGCRVHVVHHSSADAIPALRAAKAAGLPLTVETCPHYLHFAAEQIRDGATEFKCCPPIREAENRAQLWQALGDGTIDMVVSDHSPCPPDMKLPEPGDFMKAWGGISSLQLRLPIMWTDAQARGFELTRIVEWLCASPARQVAFDQKGKLAAGADADVVIWNPEAEFRVAPDMICHRHKVTPYAGERLTGVVEKTFLRGQMVYDGGEFSESKGQIVLRPESSHRV